MRLVLELIQCAVITSGIAESDIHQALAALNAENTEPAAVSETEQASENASQRELAEHAVAQVQPAAPQQVAPHQSEEDPDIVMHDIEDHTVVSHEPQHQVQDSSQTTPPSVAPPQQHIPQVTPQEYHQIPLTASHNIAQHPVAQPITYIPAVYPLAELVRSASGELIASGQFSAVPGLLDPSRETSTGTTGNFSKETSPTTSANLSLARILVSPNVDYSTLSENTRIQLNWLLQHLHAMQAEQDEIDEENAEDALLYPHDTVMEGQSMYEMMRQGNQRAKGIRSSKQKAEAERIREENRERKKRWRLSNQNRSELTLEHRR